MVITKENVVKELISRGFEVTEHQVERNGICENGLILKTHVNEIVAPVVYIDEIINIANRENHTIEKVVDEIVYIYDNHKEPSIDVKELFSKEFILKNVAIGLQKAGNEDILKRNCDEFEGLESYLMIQFSNELGGSFSIKLTDSILQISGLNEKEIWEKAEENLENQSVIEDMIEILRKNYKDLPDEMLYCVQPNPMIIVSNKNKYKGASSILNKKLVRKIAKKFNSNKLIMLPSSIHEVIVIPAESGVETDIEFLNNMVKEVNMNEVDPKERLIDRAYVMEV